MAVLDTIYDKDYRIEIVPDTEAGNPLKKGEFAPTLVLHERAERHFGWTTDKEWFGRLNQVLDAIR